MAFDADQLSALAAVVHEGSFDAAARRLHVTPSAVSQRIKALEQQVGRVLVLRTRPCRPTEDGEVLVRLAGQVELLGRDAMGLLVPAPGGSRARPATRRLPVAVNDDSMSTWFPAAVADLPADVLLDLRREDQDLSADLLRDGTVMAAVTADPRAVQGCRVRRLGAMRYLAVAAPDRRERWFADGLGAEAFAAAPLLAFNREDGLQERFVASVVGRRTVTPGCTTCRRSRRSWGWSRPGSGGGWCRRWPRPSGSPPVPWWRSGPVATSTSRSTGSTGRCARRRSTT